ncbi:Rv1355c family protein [Rhodococcus sp. NPDC003318]|uniref:Rv1355c family protein n=1 Tax=Rhodococcus sp. NPDC003318 TaxID=3364503 RepID=UPI0036C7FDBE
MTGSAGQYSATLLDERRAADAQTVAELRQRPDCVVHDTIDMQRSCLRALVPTVMRGAAEEAPMWAYYPWRRTLVHVLGPNSFRRLRLDRNRNKITDAEQQRLAALEVGVVGLSVGHAVAVALALENACGALHLADHDTLELSNLNRVPAGVFDLGVNKAIVAARRISEIDPYLRVTAWPDGVTERTVGDFLAGLDLVVEECDSLDMKVSVREEARRLRIPVLMETSDRGLLDVERFDLEPGRPLFHGLLGEVSSRSLAGLTPKEKLPAVLGILGADQLSARLGASLVEIDTTISTWPQLGGDVLLGGAGVATAVRRFGTGRPLPSGRVRVDLERALDDLAPPVHPTDADHADDAEADPENPSPRNAVVRAACAAPSGGNAQPWRVIADPGAVRLYLDPDRTSAMDVRFRGSFVALGAAFYNASVAAAAHRVLGPVEVFGDDDRVTDGSVPVVTMTFGAGADDELASRYERMLRRATNRRTGTVGPVDPLTVDVLESSARHEGARLAVLTDRGDIAAAADVLALSDRLRFLTPRLHREMMSEIRWSGEDVGTGIDVRCLELSATDLAALSIVRRGDVTAQLARWQLGAGLGDATRDRVNSSSALAAVVIGGTRDVDYFRGGSAVENVWITSEGEGFAVQPVSPVFLYGVRPGELEELAPDHTEVLAEASRSLLDLFGVAEGEAVALVLRLSHAPPPSVRSRRRSPGTES